MQKPVGGAYAATDCRTAREDRVLREEPLRHEERRLHVLGASRTPMARFLLRLESMVFSPTLDS